MRHNNSLSTETVREQSTERPRNSTITAQTLTKLLIHSKGPKIQHKPTETLDKNTPQMRYSTPKFKP
jgi:hypothetical protein